MDCPLCKEDTFNFNKIYLWPFGTKKCYSCQGPAVVESNPKLLLSSSSIAFLAVIIPITLTNNLLYIFPAIAIGICLDYWIEKKYRKLVLPDNLDHVITQFNGITKVKLIKTPTSEMIKSIIDDIADNYPYERRLWDLSSIRLKLPRSELHAISEYAQYKYKTTNKIAIVTTYDLTFGEMRQLEVHHESDGKSIPGVFRDERTAISWLNE